MSAMPSRMSLSGPRSPAACRKAAGTSLVADIARNCTISARGGRDDAQEVVHEAVARAAQAGPELPFDEGVVFVEVEAIVEDGGGDAIGVEHLRADHLGPVVEI